MIANYYTLRSIVADLHRTLSSRTISAAFSQNKNELMIVCRGDEPPEELFVTALCEPSRNALYLRPAFVRAKKNTLEFFPQIYGTEITTIALEPADRDIRISLRNGFQIMIQMFGSKANVYLADQKRTIVGAFLGREDFEKIAINETTRSIPQPPANAAALTNVLHSAGHKTIFAALKDHFPLLGATLVRELLFRATITDNPPAADLPQSQVDRLFGCFHELLQELERVVSPKIYFQGTKPLVFSIVELRMFGNLEVRTFPSIHDAVRTFLSSSYRLHGALREKAELSGTIDRELQRLEKTLNKVSFELETGGRATTYETMGKLLMANLHQIRKGMKSVTVENVFLASKDLVEIPLDPAFSPSKNGERYFEKAKKARHAASEAGERKRQLEQRIQALRKLRESLEPLETPEEWKDFLVATSNELRLLGIKIRSPRQLKEEEAPPFRVFRVEGNFEVWAGKRNDNNDLLTFKYARPNDLWFHVRGTSGSHVVLRKGSGKGDISKRAIEQAAAIAAYYSKMKTSGLVPVAVTERKYVRKPRGAPAGTVTIQREKVVMVKPALPRNADHDNADR